MRATLVALLLVSVALVGCVGSEDTDGTDQPLKRQAQVDERTGGVQGVVTDEAVQPVEGANVTLAEIDETTQTASDGSYSFSKLTPGTYTLSIEAPGFVSTSQEVEVQAGQVSTVDLILTHVFTKEAFVENIEFSAFLECGVGVGVNLSAIGGGTPSVTWATCATLNVGGNTTNDDFSENVQLEPPIDTLIVEAKWNPSGNALGEHMWLTADIQGFANLTGGEATLYQDVSAESPFKTRLDQPVFENVSAAFSARCENGEDR